MKISDQEKVLYWKKRMSDKVGSLKRQLEFDLNNMAKECEHVHLERVDILEKMQFIIIALHKLDEAILKAKVEKDE